MQSTVTKLKTDYCIRHIMHNAIHMAKLSLNFKGLVSTIRILGKSQIKMQQNAKFLHFEIAKLRCSENILFYSRW